MTVETTAKVRDVCELGDGAHASIGRTTSGVPYLTSKNLGRGTLKLDQLDYISTDDFDKHFPRYSRSITRLQAGDVLTGIIGTFGNLYVYRDSDLFGISSAIAVIRPDPAKVSSDYLYYYLSSPKLQALKEAMASGSVQGYTNLTVLGSLPVHLPPLSEQQAIAEVLGALDDKIAANTKLIETADRLAGSLTRRALDHSNTSPLTALATLTMGSSPTGSSYNEVGQGTVFYQGIRDFGIRYPENRIWTTSPVRMAERRDTLLSVRAPVGRLNLASEETCIGRGLASLRSLNGTPFTLFHVLKDSPSIWAPFEAEGTVFGSINKKQLESLEIPNIRMQLGGQLESELAALEATIENAIVETSSLTAIRDALLPPLMSAKLRLKDAEDVVSVVI